MFLRDASRQGRRLCPKDRRGCSFIIQGEWGLEKPTSFFQGVPAPLWYPVGCVFISAKGWSSNSCPWSESECRPHPIPDPMIRGNSCTSTSQASLPCSAGFSGATYYLTVFSPKSPRFPSLSMILYWDFYNNLCLLHPYHTYSNILIKISKIFTVLFVQVNFKFVYILKYTPRD